MINLSDANRELNAEIDNLHLTIAKASKELFKAEGALQFAEFMKKRFAEWEKNSATSSPAR